MEYQVVSIAGSLNTSTASSTQSPAGCDVMYTQFEEVGKGSPEILLSLMAVGLVNRVQLKGVLPPSGTWDSSIFPSISVKLSTMHPSLHVTADAGACISGPEPVSVSRSLVQALNSSSDTPRANRLDGHQP